MRLIYAQGFSKNEKEEWRAIIFNNILTAFRVILDAMEELEIPFEDQFNSVRPSFPAPSFPLLPAPWLRVSLGVVMGVGVCVWAN